MGNNDNSEMMGISGSTGAAPLWHDFMEGALAGHEVREFVVPESIRIVEICESTGAVPRLHLSSRKSTARSVRQ